MSRRHCNRWLLIVVLALMLGACIPYSFSPPKEIHINPGDHVFLGKIAVDTEGVSHIVGVVDDRIVYYRTRYGEPIITATFTMSESGTDWKQYSPGIAVTDNRTAYLVWIEQRGGPEKFACYRALTYVPPIGGWTKYCNPLDGNIQTTGNVKVIARGDKAYAVYDRMYTNEDADFGRIGALMYKELTNPSITGHVYWYTENFETGFIYSLDLGIDSLGYLHVGFHDNYPYADTLNERVSLHSNASADLDGDMAQHWFDLVGINLDDNIPVSLSFYTDSSAIEHVALAHGLAASVDLIYIDSCVADGCTNRVHHHVELPSSWDTYSEISDVEILGIGQTLHLSFIGFDNTTFRPQVYYINDAFSFDSLVNISQTEDTWKFTLEMTPVVERVPDYPGIFPATAWMETDGTSKTNYFVFDGLFNKIKVFDKYCYPAFSVGDINSNGIYLSGAWIDCGQTWFTTQAWTNQLPLIMK